MNMTRESLNPKILIVDDYPFNLEMTQDMIQMMGFQADIANSGDEAIKQWKENTYDIIFMDIQMPNKDGYATCQELRALEKETGKEPTLIIALTANAMSGDREKCLSAGMDDYIAKPLRANVLEGVLEKHIGKK